MKSTPFVLGCALLGLGLAIGGYFAGDGIAADSGSRLGRIKSARQGQFSINDRDSNNPHLKRVRVVATLEYYLAD